MSNRNVVGAFLFAFLGGAGAFMLVGHLNSYYQPTGALAAVLCTFVFLVISWSQTVLTRSDNVPFNWKLALWSCVTSLAFGYVFTLPLSR